MKPLILITWLLRLIAAVILLQTLYFKFTSHPQSVAIFSTLGMEPWGRVGTGILELITALLLLFPRTTVYGALLGFFLMAGALFFHFTKLGITVDGDNILFIYALVTFICCVLMLFFEREKIFRLTRNSKKKYRV